MTDRHSGYLVVLGRDIREDDAEGVLNALRMVKGVASVEPVPADPAASAVEIRCDLKWREALLRLVREVAGER